MIKLTDKKGNVFFINPDHVALIETSEFGSNITLVSGHTVSAKELAASVNASCPSRLQENETLFADFVGKANKLAAAPSVVKAAPGDGNAPAPVSPVKSE